MSYTRKTVGLTNNVESYYKVYCKAAREYIKMYGVEEKDLPECFVGSSKVDPIDRVKTQAAMQKHIDTAISSTVNLPETATKELMEHIYLTAWKMGLKGITIFRDKCKKAGVLTTSNPIGKKENNTNIKISELPRGTILDCSDDLIGLKRKLKNGCGSLHVMAYFDPENGDLREVFLDKGSSGGCSGYMNGLSRMLSLACRGGIDIYTLKDQLDSTESCPSYILRTKTKHDTSKGSCCPMAVGSALMDMYKQFKEKFIDSDDNCEDVDNEDYIEPKQKDTKNKEVIYNDSNNMTCPSCGAKLSAEGGCIVCKDCGWSKCD